MNEEERPLVSIITPTYNSERFVVQTIRAVQAQTLTNWEMIIVDDCSKDRTREIIQRESNHDPRIKYIFMEVNSGAAIARNTALKKAMGKYVAFLDSDDLWTPDKLSKQVQFMSENHYAFTFTSYRLMKEDGTVTNTVVKAPKRVTYRYLLRSTIIGNLTVMLDQEQLGVVQMPNIRTRQDSALWLSILKKGVTAYGLNEELAFYRKVAGSISSNKMKQVKANWKLYRDIEHLGVLYSSFCLASVTMNSIRKNVVAGWFNKYRENVENTSIEEYLSKR